MACGKGSPLRAQLASCRALEKRYCGIRARRASKEASGINRNDGDKFPTLPAKFLQMLFDVIGKYILDATISFGAYKLLFQKRLLLNTNSDRLVFPNHSCFFVNARLSRIPNGLITPAERNVFWREWRLQ